MTKLISEQIRSRTDFVLNTKVFYRNHTWRVALHQPGYNAKPDALKDAWYRNKSIEKYLTNNENVSWKTRADRSFFIYLSRPDRIEHIISNWEEDIVQISGPMNSKHQDIMLEDLQVVTRKNLWYDKFRYKIMSTRYGNNEQEIFEDMQSFCVDSFEHGTYKLNDTFKKTSKAYQKKQMLRNNVMGNLKTNIQRSLFRNQMPFTATGSIYLLEHDDVVTLHLMYKKYITKSLKVVTLKELE